MYCSAATPPNPTLPSPPLQILVFILFDYSHLLSTRRTAFLQWSRRTSTAVISTEALARILRHYRTQALARALARWHFAAAADRATAAAARADALEQECREARRKALRTATAGLVGGLKRARRASLQWGFTRLAEASAVVDMQVCVCEFSWGGRAGGRRRGVYF